MQTAAERREKRRVIERAYYERNREKINARNNARNSRPEYYLAKTEKHAALAVEWLCPKCHGMRHRKIISHHPTPEESTK